MPESGSGSSESLSFTTPRSPDVVRVGVLRAGYAGLGLAFTAFAASVYVPALVLPGLAVALVAAILLAFSQDDLPMWAGIALLAYFALTVLVFLAATPVTINKGGRYFLNSEPTAAAQEAFNWLALAVPLMVAGTAILASWERETSPRILLFGAIAGFVLVGVLSIVLVPSEGEAADKIQGQGDLVKGLFALSAGAGALGALWSAGRADEYA